MSLIEAGKEILVKLLHPQNASTPIISTPYSMIIEVTDVLSLNASFSIVLIGVWL